MEILSEPTNLAKFDPFLVKDNYHSMRLYLNFLKSKHMRIALLFLLSSTKFYIQFENLSGMMFFAYNGVLTSF